MARAALWTVCCVRRALTRMVSVRRMAALLARKAAKKWVGSRRSVRCDSVSCSCRIDCVVCGLATQLLFPSLRSVLAETDVEAVLLRKREMQWVLDNDAVRTLCKHADRLVLTD